MKIRTGEQLNSALSKDLIWRKQELTALKFILENEQKGTNQHTALLRASWALLYGHWEGFVKSAGSSYLLYLNSIGLKYNEMTSNLIALSTKGRFNTALKSDRITAHIEIANFYVHNLSEVAIIPHKDGVMTKSNLTSAILDDILKVLGLDSSRFASKKNLIDEILVANRNRIAHGHYLHIEESDYILLHEEIISMLDTFKEMIENAVDSKAFRAI